jgi:sulfur-oxidizing protein SoxX
MLNRMTGAPLTALMKLALVTRLTRLGALTVLFGLVLLIPGPVRAEAEADATRGRVLLEQRQQSGCILCHVVPGLPAGGALGPPLLDLDRRYSPQTLFQRIADARRTNPDTIMPPYLSTDGLNNVARAQVGQTVLSPQAVADIAAYLLAPPSAAHERP